jgi:serine/threonine-protein kinase RsbW
MVTGMRSPRASREVSDRGLSALAYPRRGPPTPGPDVRVGPRGAIGVAWRPSVGTQQTVSEVVRLTVPAALEYVRIVRLTASGVASRLGLDVDEIENMRVAVDELASTVVDAADGGELEILFSNASGSLRIEGKAPVAIGGEVRVDDLSAQILKAVCDDYDLGVVEDTARFACSLRLPSA